MNDVLLGQRIRRASGLLREIIDLADEQGWTYRVKDEGLLFFPPKGAARPGFTQIFASDPGNQSHTIRRIRERFKKAGMKFPAQHERSTMSEQKVPTASSAGPPNPYARARQKINAAVGLLSELEQILGEIECDGQQLQKLREVLKGL